MGNKYQVLDQCTLKYKFGLNSDLLSVYTCGNLHPKRNTWLVEDSTHWQGWMVCWIVPVSSSLFVSNKGGHSPSMGSDSPTLL